VKRLLRLVALTTLSYAAGLHAQQKPDPLDPCGAMPRTDSAAAKHFLTFVTFDKELRDALDSQDAVALAFLVQFPLRVNDQGGTISIDDAAALKTHFQEVFTPSVRKEILNDHEEPGGCSVEGVGYARGVIWVQASERGYAIYSVNRDSVPPYPRGNTPRIEYVCQTQTHRIVIDTLADGKLRYRSWNKPRPVAGAPDLELEPGAGTFEGTDVCAVPIYTFKNDKTVFTIDGGVGCGPDSGPDALPKNATGHLLVKAADKTVLDAWCY
jgi:hypothetical protein